MNRKLLNHIKFWIGMFCYYVSAVWPVESNKMALIEKYLFKVSLQAVLSYIIILVLIPKLLNKGKKSLFVLSSLSAVYFVHVTYTACRSFYLDLKYPSYFQQHDFLPRALDFYLYFYNIAWFIFPTIILVAWQYYIDQKEVATLREQKRETELNALKSQLNPHFLFNTLNNLYMLTLKKSDQAPEVIMKLSKMLDYMLYQCSDTFVNISGELSLLQHYIALEKLRYGKRLAISFVHELEEDVPIAPLLLLTFVENAFKHGVSQEINVATVEILLKASQHRILFEVQNSKPSISGQGGNSGELTPSGGNSIGLQNVKKQLSLLYPNAFDLEIEDSEDWYKVKLELKV